jgi:molybdopterin-synthase adenylyltransferase
LTEQEKERYSRQIFFAPIGETGQEKIRNARICVVGCGALGSFQAEAIARAGVRAVRLIDRDYVEISNLQRQWLYDENDAEAETPKAIAAAQRLEQINRGVEIEPVVADLTPSNAEDLLADCDLIFDGTDNFETRYLINDVSVKHNVPWIYGAAIGSYGIVMPIWPDHGPCFSCVYPEPPRGLQPTCDVDGVLAAATASVAALQTAFALRLIVGWNSFDCHVYTLDVWTGARQEVAAGTRDPECVTCGRREFRFLDGRRRVPVSLCGRNAVQLHERERPLDLQELANRLQRFGETRVNEFALRMKMDDYELTFFPDGRAIVKGTTDVGVARSLYARLIGG